MEDDQGERCLVDTKYKVLDPDKDHAGLSQEDFYQMYAYGRAGKETYTDIFLLYPTTGALAEHNFYQDGLTLRTRQFDPRAIYDPDTGRLDVDATIEELSRALSRRT